MQRSPYQQQELPSHSDPARHFENAEPWATRWQFRFVPPNQLSNLNVAADHGLERLLYLQTLISEEIESAPAAVMTASAGVMF